MPSYNRKRLTIQQPGKPRLYQLADISGWEVLGTVTRGESDTGALVRNRQTGIYAQANAGAIRSLDQRKVLAALGHGSRINQEQREEFERFGY